jgi:fructose-1,6-bisphosphatase/inositol monophosphatase family enzyme
MPSKGIRADVVRSSDAVLNIASELLARGCNVRFKAAGCSMHPTIADGETVILAAIQPIDLRAGDVVVARVGSRLVAHRIVSVTPEAPAPVRVVLRGDAAASCDPPVRPEDVLARVVAVDRSGRQVVPGHAPPAGPIRRLRSATRRQVRRLADFVSAQLVRRCPTKEH